MLLQSPSNRRADFRPVWFQTKLSLRDYFVLSRIVLQFTHAPGFWLPRDAFIAALVHAPLGHFVRSTSPRALLDACGHFLAIRAFGRHAAAPLGQIAVYLVPIVAPRWCHYWFSLGLNPCAGCRTLLLRALRAAD